MNKSAVRHDQMVVGLHNSNHLGRNEMKTLRLVCLLWTLNMIVPYTAMWMGDYPLLETIVIGTIIFMPTTIPLVFPNLIRKMYSSMEGVFDAPKWI